MQLWRLIEHAYRAGLTQREREVRSRLVEFRSLGQPN